jgi:general secretion pathway protein C
VNVQDLVKRHFWVVGAVTVAVCAFFGGRCVAHVVEAAVLTDPSQPAKVDPVAQARPAQVTRSKSGQPFADRNIFCSECVPPEPVAADTTPAVAADGGTPLTSLPLVLIATFIADDYRMATILNTETQSQGGYALVKRGGETRGDKIPGAGEIVAITHTHVDFTNAGVNRVERVSLLDVPRPTAPVAPPTVTSTPVDTGQPKDEMQAALDAGIRKIDDTTYEVDRSLVDKLLQNPLAASKGARVTPSIKNGQPNGIKLYAIRPASVYAKLGLSNGDTIHSINGNELDSLDKGLEVYQKVKDATSLQVSVTRRGKPMTLNYSVK